MTTIKPRSIDEIDEALKAVKIALIRHAITLPPQLTISLPTILDVLTAYKALKESI